MVQPWMHMIESSGEDSKNTDVLSHPRRFSSNWSGTGPKHQYFILFFCFKALLGNNYKPTGNCKKKNKMHREAPCTLHPVSPMIISHTVVRYQIQENDIGTIHRADWNVTSFTYAHVRMSVCSSMQFYHRCRFTQPPY